MHLSSDLDLGGAEVALTEFVTRLDPSRFHPAVCTLRRVGTGVLNERLQAAGIEVFHVPFHTHTSPRSIWQLSRLLKREGVQIVHTHLRRSGFAGRLAALLAGIPVIIHHEHSLEREKKSRQRCLYRYLAKHTNATLCVSGHVLRDRLAWTGAAPENFSVLANGIDLARFSTCTESPATIRAELGIPQKNTNAKEAFPPSYVLGTVGRLTPIKNQSLFLRVCAEVLKKRPGGHILLVGDGKSRADLAAEAVALGIAERVTFAGARGDIERLLRCLDVFVFTSESEGFGLVPLEAQAAGVPVVTTPAGAVEELIAHEETGLLVRDETPESIAEAVMRILDDKNLATRLRDKGKVAAQQYELSAVVTRLEEIYENCLSVALASRQAR